MLDTLLYIGPKGLIVVSFARSLIQGVGYSTKHRRERGSPKPVGSMSFSTK